MSVQRLTFKVRDGVISYETLLQRSPPHANNFQDFHEAVHSFYDSKTVVKFKYDKLSSLGTPIATIKAIHSSPTAAAADAGDLCPVVFLAKGARVMLTANLWQQVGLCNGAAGTVYDIVYQEGHAPPYLPIAVLVQFENYSGPPIYNHCVPITHKWTDGAQQLSHQQLPLTARYAITIHKSQGQTLGKAVIDLGKSELAAGCTFVAISRFKKLEDALFQLMIFEGLLQLDVPRG